MTHDHHPKHSETKRIVGSGSFSLEVCDCGALRSVVVRAGRPTTYSAWEIPDEEESALYWDGLADNDNTEDQGIMDPTIKAHWQAASTIAQRQDKACTDVSFMLVGLAQDTIEIFDDHNPPRRRYIASLAARYVEKDLMRARQRLGAMSAAETEDFETLQNALRYAESVFAETL